VVLAALYRAARLDGRTRGGLALLVTWAICSGLLLWIALAGLTITRQTPANQTE
jgi:hypothetical protein